MGYNDSRFPWAAHGSPRQSGLPCIFAAFAETQYPEVGPNWSHCRFKGRGQRDTPIATIRGAVELAFLLPGRHAARIRRQAADLLVRWLGGDLNIISEVCALRGLQEE